MSRMPKEEESYDKICVVREREKVRVCQMGEMRRTRRSVNGLQLHWQTRIIRLFSVALSIRKKGIWIYDK